MPMASLAGRSSPGKHQTVSQSCSAPLPRAEPSDSILLSYQRGALLHFFFSSRRRHTRWNCDWSSDVGSSDLGRENLVELLDEILTTGSAVTEMPLGWE